MKEAYVGISKILITARPENVWTALEDSTLLPQWAPMVKQTNGKKESRGSVRTCHVEWEGRKDEVVERCIEAIPYQKITWVMEKGMMTRMFSKIQFGFQLQPSGPNATALQMEFLYQPRNLLARLMYSLLMKKKMEQLRQTLLENLKKLVEKCDINLTHS